MPAECQKNSSLPSLEQLQEALVRSDLEQLQRLRQQLDWSPKCDKPVTSALTQDPGYDRLHLMLESYGPSCLNCKNSDGNTLVHLTAKTCETEAAMELILTKLGGDKGSLDCFGVKGKDKSAAVHFAAENRSNAALKWLVQKLGPDCLKLQNGLLNVPMHIAAQFQGADSMELVRAELGDDSFKRTGEHKRTPFHCAATNERSHEALAWLIKTIGSESLIVEDKHSNTPVHLAARFQDEGSMELLKESLGSDLFALLGFEGQSVIHAAARNVISNSALIWCIKNVDASGLLLATDSLDRTALHLAAQYQNELSIDIAVSALDKKGVKYNLQSGDEALLDKTKCSVVHYAAMNEISNSALRWFVRKLGPSCLKLRDANKRTPIHLVGWHQGIDSLCFIRNCLGSSAFQLVGRNKRILAHYAAENRASKAAGAEMLSWMVREVGPQCMLAPDAQEITAAGITAAKLAA